VKANALREWSVGLEGGVQDVKCSVTQCGWPRVDLRTGGLPWFAGVDIHCAEGLEQSAVHVQLRNML
jgi:hypothetical protein